MKSFVLALAVGLVVASSGIARAQQPTLAGPAPQGEANGIIAPQKSGSGSNASSTPAKSTTGGGKDEGYGYEFSDDPLAAGGFGPNDATIRVRPGPVRTTLIRPRTSFVPEMLKSVENL